MTALVTAMINGVIGGRLELLQQEVLEPDAAEGDNHYADLKGRAFFSFMKRPRKRP